MAGWMVTVERPLGAARRRLNKGLARRWRSDSNGGIVSPVPMEEVRPTSCETALVAEFDPNDRAVLLLLARTAIERAARLEPAEIPAASDLPPRCREPRACFVTLTRAGELRGCIGTLAAADPLYRAVIDNAAGAAARDSRFEPVTSCEVPELVIEISVLSALRPLHFASPDELLTQLCPGRDGVVLRVDDRRSTFLPQVWKDIPNKVDFLDRLCLKAGVARGAWQRRGAEVDVYTVESFHGSD